MFSKSLMPLFLLLAVFLCGCATVKYTGPTYAPTKHIAVFYGKTQIKTPYTVMGKASVSSWYTYQSDSLVPALVAKAKECGADAILIDSIDEHITAPAISDDEDSSVSLRSSVDPEAGVNTEERILFDDGDSETESMDVSKIVAEFLKYKK